jgi:hypothetical protein
MKNTIKVIGFDADDTLWVNEPNYQETEKEFCRLLESYVEESETSGELFKTEMQNLESYGFGAKGFLLSMIETAIRVTNGTITSGEIGSVIGIGKSLLDKPSHSSLTESNGNLQIVEKGSDGSYMASSLIGMTTKPIESLLPLARSWNYPPLLKIGSPGFKDCEYDKYQRAYLLKAVDPKAKKLEIQVDASETSPVQNLAFVIENLDFSKAIVKVNNQLLTEGEDYFIGEINGLEQDKTVIFIKTVSFKPLTISIVKL